MGDRMTVLKMVEACGCDAIAVQQKLENVDIALAKVLRLVKPVDGIENRPLSQALNRVLAQPVLAAADMPRFDNSGMDGYAFRHCDPDGEMGLPVVGVCAAGSAPACLTPGTAMRIYTGAPVPLGADTVVMQEHVESAKGRIEIRQTPPLGSNIRLRGADLRKGEMILPAGSILDARGIAACAGAGAGEVAVYRKPRVALVQTGDELTPAGSDMHGSKIWDINTPMLEALAREAGAEMTKCTFVEDTPQALAHAIAECRDTADIIISSGGVSVGDRDYVKSVLENAGAEIVVSGVAMKPGKPVTITTLGHSLVLSLPGNPVSAFVTWQIFGRAILKVARGSTFTGHEVQRVRCGMKLHHKPGRREYRPATLVKSENRGEVYLTAGEATHSNQIVPLLAADGFVVIPDDQAVIAEGDMVDFLPL